MKVGFLDIDGVLCTRKSFLANGGIPSITNFAVWMFDQTSLAAIRQILVKTDAKVVLTSTWRKYVDRERLAEVLGLPIVDVTKDLGNRGKEIAEWLQRQPEGRVESYVVLDDFRIEGVDDKNFIHVSSDDGITFDQLVRMWSILAGEEIPRPRILF